MTDTSDSACTDASLVRNVHGSFLWPGSRPGW